MIISRIIGFVIRRMNKIRAYHYLRPFIKKRPDKIYIHETIRELQNSEVEIIHTGFTDEEVNLFKAEAEYEFYYPDYYSKNDLVRLKKLKEHFVAAKLLNLNKNDVYLDIASQASPAPQVYERLYGYKVFRQDLIYKNGVHGRLIGGDASHIPLEDNSISKAAMHCSLEHFENDSDIHLIREIERILKRNGLFVIVPLYLSDEYFVSTQPGLWCNLPKSKWPVFPQNARKYVFNSHNRFERYYSFSEFNNRIIKNTNMTPIIHQFKSDEYYHPGQMYFGVVFENKQHI